MLKIKDTVPLEDLQLYGFNQKDYSWTSDKYYLTTKYFNLWINPEDRSIFYEPEEETVGRLQTDDDLEVLYNLITSGLVEKVC